MPNYEATALGSSYEDVEKAGEFELIPETVGADAIVESAEKITFRLDDDEEAKGISVEVHLVIDGENFIAWHNLSFYGQSERIVRFPWANLYKMVGIDGADAIIPATPTEALEHLQAVIPGRVFKADVKHSKPSADGRRFANIVPHKA